MVLRVAALSLIAMLVLVTPARAQDLGSRLAKLDEQAEGCQIEKEYVGGQRSLEKSLERLRQQLRRGWNYPLFCEAYRGGRWVGASCWDD